MSQTKKQVMNSKTSHRITIDYTKYDEEDTSKHPFIALCFNRCPYHNEAGYVSTTVTSAKCLQYIHSTLYNTANSAIKSTRQ